MSQSRKPSPLPVCVSITSDRAQIDALRDQIVDAVESQGYTPASAFAVRLAFEEAITNAFRHGHRGLPPDAPVTVRFRVAPDEIEIDVQDAGPGFNPGAIPDPTLDQNLEMPSGRGLLLIRAYMSEVDFNERGNRVRMVYRRPED